MKTHSPGLDCLSLAVKAVTPLKGTGRASTQCCVLLNSPRLELRLVGSHGKEPWARAWGTSTSPPMLDYRARGDLLPKGLR